MPSDAPTKIPPQKQDRQPGIEAEMTPRPAYEPRYPGSGRLNGKVAVISGGDSGIGRATAILFAREGANVAIGYFDEDEDAEETMRLVEEEGGRAIAVAGDIGDPDTARALVEQTLDAFGRLDILVNNAAVQYEQETIEAIDPEQLEKTFRTNVFGMFHLTRAALPHLSKGSAIINTTSITAYEGHKVLVDYSATKGAIATFTRSLAGQLAEKGIRVNAVAPGPIWTPLIPASFEPERVAQHGQSTKMKRPGQPNEVAPCYLFLACDDSSYMTGQVLHPDGGEAANT